MADMLEYFQNMKQCRRKSGFSIMEVMIAMVIAVLVITLIVKALSDAGQESRRLTQKNDFNGLVNEIQTVLNSADTCLAALQMPPATPGDPPPTDFILPTTAADPLTPPITIELKIRGTGAAATVFKVGTDYGGLTIKTLEISAMKPGLSPTEFEVPITLVATRKGATGVAATNDFKPYVFNVVLGVTPASAVSPLIPGKVLRCSASIPSFWVKGTVPPPVSSSSSSPPASQVNIYYPGGAVGIGTSAPKDNLDVKGSFYADKIYYNISSGPSDIKLKENIRPLSNSLEKVLKLHGVKFDWKDKTLENSRDNIGFIAQDVEKVFPEFVHTHSQRGFKTVSYDKLVAPLVEAIKEQQKIIMRQQKEIDEIKRALSER